MADDAKRPAEDREPTTAPTDESGTAPEETGAGEAREDGPERPSGGTVGASVLRGSLLGAGVLLVAALLVIVNYLGWKYHWRFDWTETELYSLSETTENVLRDLEGDVRVTVFITPGSRLYEPTRELLSRYEARSPRLSVLWLDPERNPAEAERLIQQYDVAAASVVFEAGEERRVVAAEDLAEIDFSQAQMGQQPEISAFQGEERFTSALVDLTQGDKPRVLFTTGHGELSLDDPADGGLGTAREVLGPDNVEIDEWSSLGAEAVPEGTDLVVIAGPQAAFTGDELSVLGGYLAGGGRLLVFLDPVFQAGGPESGMADLGLQAWLQGYGVDVGDDLVVDPTTTPMGFSAETFFATRYGSHPATRSLADGSIPVLVRHSRSIGTASAPDGATVTELFETSADGWAVTSFDRESFAEPGEEDVRGPVALAVAVEAEVQPEEATPAEEAPGAPEGDDEAAPPEAGDAGAAPGEGQAGAEGDAVAARAEAEASSMRLAVVGDSDFASNSFLQMGPGNQTFLNNLFNWLIERETLLGIPPKRPEQVRLSMTPSELRWSVAFVVLVLPGLAVALGLAVWSRRRKAR